MRVRMTLEVPEPARLHIAGLGAPDIDSRALATRDGIRDYIQRYVQALAEDASALSLGPLTDAEIKDAKEAVTFLRAKGMRDHEIRSWLLMQQARIQVATRNIESDRRFGQPHYGHQEEIA